MFTASKENPPIAPFNLFLNPPFMVENYVFCIETNP